MAPKKTYYPAKTFDDDFAAFTQMCATNSWTFPGIAQTDLEAAVTAQRSERADHDKVELAYLKAHEKFGVAQATRYALYAAALNAARGVFRNNKEVLAQLERFKAARVARKKAESPKVPPK